MARAISARLLKSRRRGSLTPPSDGRSGCSIPPDPAAQAGPRFRSMTSISAGGSSALLSAEWDIPQRGKRARRPRALQGRAQGARCKPGARMLQPPEQQPRRRRSRCRYRTNPVTPGLSVPATGIVPVAGTRAHKEACKIDHLQMQSRFGCSAPRRGWAAPDPDRGDRHVPDGGVSVSCPRTCILSIGSSAGRPRRGRKQSPTTCSLTSRSVAMRTPARTSGRVPNRGRSDRCSWVSKREGSGASCRSCGASDRPASAVTLSGAGTPASGTGTTGSWGSAPRHRESRLLGGLSG